MDSITAARYGGKDEKKLADESTREKKQDMVTKDFPSRDADPMKQVGDNGMGNTSPVSSDDAGDVNMEAAISTEEVVRAGGFGARDDIGSFLPVAIDSTDFEASLRDAREFEDEKEEPSHPGLGWTGSDVQQQ